MTYGLKTQFSGIKITTVYRRSISQVEWLIATLICGRFRFLRRKSRRNNNTRRLRVDLLSRRVLVVLQQVVRRLVPFHPKISYALCYALALSHQPSLLCMTFNSLASSFLHFCSYDPGLGPRLKHRHLLTWWY